MKRDETPEGLREAIKEQTARQEWAAQEKLIAQIHDDLLSLPLEARTRVLQQFCVACGIDNPSCTCTWSDEERKEYESLQNS